MTGAPLVVACPDCRTATSACHACGQYGGRRAQLVLTVANLDTGAVASVEVVPDVFEPRPTVGGGWQLALTPLLRDLAASVGAGSFHHVSAPHQPVGERLVALPEQWRPELPAEDRYDLEAAAIAGWTRTPWQVFLGRTAWPAPDPDRRLTRLRAAADLLCLDLVVEARRLADGATGLGWEVRYELPGSAPPERPAAVADPPAAVAATTGYPGARRFVRDDRPEVPPLADLIRLALGLGLVVTVTVQNHRLDDGDPLQPHVEINASALPVGVPEPPIHPTIETAIADALECLDLALAEAVPADPGYPIPVPSAPQPVPVADPLPLLTQLGDRYAGQPVAVRFDPDGCYVRLVASSPSLAQRSVSSVTAGTRRGRGPARSASSGR